MRKSYCFFFFLTLNLLNASYCDSVMSADLGGNVLRREVQNVEAVGACITEDGRGLFCFDADEVLFTYRVNPATGEAELIPLIDDFKDLIRRIESCGHAVVIITYNYAKVIRDKLDQVGIRGTIPEIIACEMTGDLDTAKGALLESYVEGRDAPFDFWVFIDNFLPFVEDVERVAARRRITLFSFVCCGYLEHYPAYVYWYLARLQEEIKDGAEGTDEKEIRIMNSLRKYNISLIRFREDHPTLKVFLRKTLDLRWPYLVYL
jgi:hypothetical protein